MCYPATLFPQSVEAVQCGAGEREDVHLAEPAAERVQLRIGAENTRVRFRPIQIRQPALNLLLKPDNRGGDVVGWQLIESGEQPRRRNRSRKLPRSADTTGHARRRAESSTPAAPARLLTAWLPILRSCWTRCACPPGTAELETHCILGHADGTINPIALEKRRPRVVPG
jgi:hypothetical protein